MKHVGIIGIIEEGVREQGRKRGKHVRKILGSIKCGGFE